MTFAETERLIDRYDAATSALDSAVTDRISASLDASFRNLIRELEVQYPTWQSQGSLYASQRRLLLVTELGGLLSMIKPQDLPTYQELLQEALQLSHTTGATLADELIRATDPGYPLADFTTIPIEAAVAQARDGVGRLYRYSEEFRTAASGIVEAGLIQGWGTKRVQGLLERELGVAKSKAETLARTEILSALNTASQERYQRAGVEWVQVFLSPSEASCSFCVARHGNIYEAAAISVPFHPRCRCLVCPAKASWQQQGLTDDAAVEASRAAIVAEFEAQGGRLDNGATFWEKKAGLTAAPTPVWKPGDAIAAAPVAARAGAGGQKPEVPTKANQAYFDKWGDSYKDAPPLFKRVLDKLDYPEEIPSDGTAGAYQTRNKIHMGTFEPGVGRGSSVWRHEYGHFVDRTVRSNSSADGYRSAEGDGTEAMGKDAETIKGAAAKAVKSMKRDIKTLVNDAYNPTLKAYNYNDLRDAGMDRDDANEITRSFKPPTPATVLKKYFNTDDKVRMATVERYEFETFRR